MIFSSLREFFAPVRLDSEPEFRAELEQHWRRGLRIIGVLELAVPLVMLAIREVYAEVWQKHVPVWSSLTMMGIGAAALVAAKLPRRWLLGAAFLAGLATAGFLSYVDYGNPAGVAYAAADMLTVLLVALAALPSGFWFVLLFALAVWTLNAIIGVNLGFPVTPTAVAQMMISSIVVATLAGISFRRMLSAHRAHRATLEAELRQAQSESAASMARIAAALSHELNTPLGALKSSVNSLVSVGAKLAQSPEPRLLDLQRDLARVATESAVRLEDIIQRMQRFTNLDRAEVQQVDVGRVLQDVLGLCLHKNQVQLQLCEAPWVVAQPQVLSAAFAEVLQKATEASAAVAVEVRAQGAAVQVQVRTTASLEPGFGVKNGRMAAVNMDLLHIRNLLRSQGGDVASTDGGVTITLPVHQA